MATRSKHFCNHAGCNILTADTYCIEHAPLHVQQRADYRVAAAKRGYDAKWQQVRARYLRRHPLCERCTEKGRFIMASMVHHIIPISDGGARLDPRNFQALCRDCHEVIHGRKAELDEGQGEVKSLHFGGV